MADRRPESLRREPAVSQIRQTAILARLHPLIPNLQAYAFKKTTGRNSGRCRFMRANEPDWLFLLRIVLLPVLRVNVCHELRGK